jgi:hypothetical protein
MSSFHPQVLRSFRPPQVLRSCVLGPAAAGQAGAHVGRCVRLRWASTAFLCDAGPHDRAMHACARWL